MEFKRTLPFLSGLAIFSSWAIGTVALWTSWLLPASLLMLWALGFNAWWPYGLLIALAGLPGCILFAAFLYEDFTTT